MKKFSEIRAVETDLLKTLCNTIESDNDPDPDTEADSGNAGGGGINCLGGRDAERERHCGDPRYGEQKRNEREEDVTSVEVVSFDDFKISEGFKARVSDEGAPRPSLA